MEGPTTTRERLAGAGNDHGRGLGVLAAALIVLGSIAGLMSGLGPEHDLTTGPMEGYEGVVSLVASAEPDHAIVYSLQGSLSVVPKSNFEGLARVESGNPRPPDPQVAAGPDHVVEIVNYAIEAFDKQGNRFWNPPRTLKAFFQSQDTMFDPQILYDRLSGHWFVSAAQYNGTARRTPTPIKVAVSMTSDPTGGWWIYNVVGRGDPDQPFIGVGSDKFVVTWNSYSLNNGRWSGTEYAVLNKAQMITGASSPAAVYFGPDGSVLGVHPVESHDSTPIQYMVGRAWKTGTEIKYYAISGVPGGGKVQVTTVLVPIVSNMGSTDAEQPTTDIDLDTNTGRVRVIDASWYQNRLWFSVNSRCLPVGDTANRSCLRLTQLDTSTPSQPRILQEFDHGEAGRDLFYGALSIDVTGNLGVIYGYSSETEFPSLAVTGQSTTDPAETLKPSVTVVVGFGVDAVPAPYPFDNSNRYGDYFGAVTDPVDRTLIWAVGEYQPTSAWGTYIASFRIEEFALEANPSSATVVQGNSTTFAVSVASLGGFTRPVGLTAAVSPSGPTVSLSANTATPAPGGTATVTLTVSTTTSTPAAGYVVTVTGTSGSVSASTTIPVTVNSPGGGGDGGSVAYGTLVTMEDGAEVPVQNLKVGDRLLGYDTDSDTFTVAVIGGIEVVGTTNLLVINTEAGMPFRVDANPRQTLWVKTAEGTIGWLGVTEIDVGDFLFTVDGWVRVTSTEFAPRGWHVKFDIIASAPYFAAGYLDPPVKP